MATAITSAFAGLTMAWPLVGAAFLIASAFAASITFTGKANLHSALDSSRYVYCNMPGYAIFTTTTAI